MKKFIRTTTTTIRLDDEAMDKIKNLIERWDVDDEYDPENDDDVLAFLDEVYDDPELFDYVTFDIETKIVE